jgi:hypothetical protein
LFMLASASIFVNVITPSGMVGAVTLFVDQARREKYSVARATMAGLLFVLYDYLGLICVMVLGLLVLFRRNNLDTPEIVASIILVSIAIALGSLFVIGMGSAERLGRLLAWSARLLNRVLYPFIHREYIFSQQQGIADRGPFPDVRRFSNAVYAWDPAGGFYHRLSVHDRVANTGGDRRCGGRFGTWIAFPQRTTGVRNGDRPGVPRSDVLDPVSLGDLCHALAWMEIFCARDEGFLIQSAGPDWGVIISTFTPVFSVILRENFSAAPSENWRPSRGRGLPITSRSA